MIAPALRLAFVVLTVALVVAGVHWALSGLDDIVIGGAR